MPITKSPLETRHEVNLESMGLIHCSGCAKSITWCFNNLSRVSGRKMSWPRVYNVLNRSKKFDIYYFYFCSQMFQVKIVYRAAKLQVSRKNSL